MYSFRAVVSMFVLRQNLLYIDQRLWFRKESIAAHKSRAWSPSATQSDRAGDWGWESQHLTSMGADPGSPRSLLSSRWCAEVWSIRHPRNHTMTYEALALSGCNQSTQSSGWGTGLQKQQGLPPQAAAG